MSSIRRRPDGRSPAHHKDPAGAGAARHFDRRIDAQRWRNDMTTGTCVDPSAGRISLNDDVTQQWLPAQVHLRPNTQRRSPYLAPLKTGASRRTVLADDARHSANDGAAQSR